MDERLWQRVQAILQRNGRTGGAPVRNRYGALLKGLLWCTPCNCSMGHTYSTQGTKRYRYYVCLNAQKRGWHNCPSKSVPAGEMERFVVEQIKSVGRDPAVLAETLRQARLQSQQALAGLKVEERAVGRELVRLNAELQKLATDPTGDKADRLADVQERIRAAEGRAGQIREQMAALSGETVDEREIRSALSSFDPVWDTLSPREQARIIRLLVERVDYDGKAGSCWAWGRLGAFRALLRGFWGSAAGSGRLFVGNVSPTAFLDSPVPQGRGYQLRAA